MIIREIAKEDLYTRVMWMNNPKVYESMHYDIPILYENTLTWFDSIKNNDKRSDVTFIENNQIVAFGGITNIDNNIKKGELYIFVNPEIQSRGYGYVATKLLCEYAFNDLKLHKVFLQTNSDNIAAQKVYEKCGYVLEGILRHECINKNGEWSDRLYYGLINDGE